MKSLFQNKEEIIRKKLPPVTNKQFNELMVKLGLAHSDLNNVNNTFAHAKETWAMREEDYGNRISNLQNSLCSLEQEKSNLMEVIEGLGEVLGENKNEIKRLKQKDNQSVTQQTNFYKKQKY